MREIADEFRQWRAAGDPVAIATVVETWGSSPRPLGSKMLVSGSGKMAGSVSNGCVEGAVFEAAQEVLASGRPRLVEYGVADDIAFEVGLACGGHIEVLIQPAGEMYDRALNLLAAEQPFLLRTRLGEGETQLIERGPDFELARRDGQTFEEPFGRPAQMVIVGAIHIAIPLHRMAKLMGYRVTIVDARGQFATAERFPDADQLLVQWPDEALAGLTIDRSTAVAVGAGCGGPMDLGGGHVSPINIPAWRGFPLRARLAAHTGLPVFVDNDAKALAIGEGWTGAAAGVAVTIGAAARAET